MKPSRCDDSNMIMGVERKWAPTMMKLDGGGGRQDSLEIDENGGEERKVIPQKSSVKARRRGINPLI